MKLTIVMGPQWPLPPAGFGAVEKVWFSLANAFAECGHEVCLIGKGGGLANERRLPTGVRVVELKGFSASGRLWLDLCRDLIYALRLVAVIPRSDVVVTNCFSLPVVLAPIKFLKGRIVVHVARFPKGQMWLYRGADSVQTISGAVGRAVVAQCGALKSRVTVVGYPVDIDRYRPPLQEREVADAPTVLFVGRVHPEKGVHLLVDAFKRVVARVPKARLRVIGPTSEAQGGGGAAYFRSLQVAASGMSVEFAAAISSPSELAQAYRQADCFCYPSLAEKGEAFGLAVLEAMASGLPCVVSRLECFEDFVENGVDAMVFNHRGILPMEALSDAICSIITNPQHASDLSRNARLRAEQFTVERIAATYLGLFSSLIPSVPAVARM